MSGYGGRPPSGEEDPYGAAPSGGAYGPPGGGQAPYGPPQGLGPGGPAYAYGPPGVPSRTVSPGTITAALVCNSIAIVLCCNIAAVAGVITALHAQRRVETDPRSARKLTIWSWSLFVVSTLIGIIIAVVYLILTLNSDPGYSSSG